MMFIASAIADDPLDRCEHHSNIHILPFNFVSYIGFGSITKREFVSCLRPNEIDIQKSRK